MGQGGGGGVRGVNREDREYMPHAYSQRAGKMDQIHSKGRTPKGHKRPAVSDANREKAKKRWVRQGEAEGQDGQDQQPGTSGEPNPHQSSTGGKLNYFRKPNLNESLESTASDISEAGEFMIVHKSFWASFVAGMVCSQCYSKELKVAS